MRGGAWKSAVHGVVKSRIQLSDFTFTLGFPGSLAGKESASNAGDPGSIPGSESSPEEGIDYPLQYSWASLVAQMVKNLPAMRETWVWSLGWEDPLQEGMATHSSTLAWRIPWTEEPGRLQSMKLQRVRHNWVTKQTELTYGRQVEKEVKKVERICIIYCMVKKIYSNMQRRLLNRE